MHAKRTEMHATIQSALAAGKTVYICSATRATKVTPAIAAKWDAIGRPLFKLAPNGLYMGAGRGYVCIDYCAIRTETR